MTFIRLFSLSEMKKSNYINVNIIANTSLFLFTFWKIVWRAFLIRAEMVHLHLFPPTYPEIICIFDFARL